MFIGLNALRLIVVRIRVYVFLGLRLKNRFEASESFPGISIVICRNRSAIDRDTLDPFRIINERLYYKIRYQRTTVVDIILCIVKRASYEEEEKFGGSSEYYRYDEKLLEEVRDPAEFLAGKMDITPKQAVLFSIIVEMSKCDDFSKRELSDKLKTSFVQLLSYEDDLKALESALIIKRGRWGKIRVGEEVLRCLEKNKAFKRPAITDLKTFTILSRMTRLFRDIRNQEVDKEIALNEMDAMILANPATSIAKTANRYGILKEGAKVSEDYDEEEGWQYFHNLDYEDCMCPAERLLFYALCFRYHDCDDDYCGWWDFRDFFDENTLETLQQYYKDEELSLQEKKVITYAARDGMLVKDHFKIEDSVKEEILAALCSYCSDFYARINLFEQELFAKINSTNCEKLFKKSVDAYIRSHENEPLFQIYTLVQSEKYFNKNFLDICETQRNKIFDQSFLFFKIASAQTKGSAQKPDEILRLRASFFTDGILSRLDSYIAHKKETIRRNPECDAGSLFALPSDEKKIGGITAFAVEILRNVV